MGRLKVLVAEECQSVRTAAIEVLLGTKLVSSVLEANNGNKALELLLQHDPEITLIDTNLHLLTGCQVIKSYRYQKPEGKTVFVMTSGFPECYENVANSLGVYFLKKPYDISEIREKMTRIAERISRSKGE
jgi:YesN/AraC family two-component response regulator